jgi:hypothetical protein
MVIYDVTDFGVTDSQIGIICICILQPRQHRNGGTLEAKNLQFQEIVLSRRNKTHFELVGRQYG